jgi:hypothetical protein
MKQDPDPPGEDQLIKAGPPDEHGKRQQVQTICIDLKKSLREKSITQKTKQTPAGK